AGYRPPRRRGGCQRPRCGHGRVPGRHGRRLSGKHRGDPLGRSACPRRGGLMISRYTRPEMAAIWEPQTRFKIWFEIEAHAADAQAELGVIPREAAKTVWAKARNVTFDVGRIDEIERETRHDVIAFLTHLAEIVGPEARF